MTKIQQGDVVLIKVDSLPKEAKLKKGARVVQEGEHTGHAHRLNENGSVWEMGDQKYVRIDNEYATLTHEEHNTEIIERGDYEVRIVRQKDPFSKIVSRVVD
jgi:hypothetical protein